MSRGARPGTIHLCLLCGCFILIAGLPGLSRCAGRSAFTNSAGSVVFSSSRRLDGLTNLTLSSRVGGTDALDDNYRLAIGDRLSFRIEEDLEEAKAILVTDCGEVELPYLGRFPAEHKTCQSLAREIKAALEKEYYYHATVIIAVDQMTKSRGRIYLVGPLRSPGPQEIPSDEVLTLSKAILRAGGFTDFADRHNVKLTRKVPGSSGASQTFTVDVDQILQKGKTDKDLVLETGDLILVSERLVRF